MSLCKSVPLDISKVSEVVEIVLPIVIVRLRVVVVAAKINKIKQDVFCQTPNLIQVKRQGVDFVFTPSQ